MPLNCIKRFRLNMPVTRSFACKSNHVAYTRNVLLHQVVCWPHGGMGQKNEVDLTDWMTYKQDRLKNMRHRKCGRQTFNSTPRPLDFIVDTDKGSVIVAFWPVWLQRMCIQHLWWEGSGAIMICLLLQPNLVPDLRSLEWQALISVKSSLTANLEGMTTVLMVYVVYKCGTQVWEWVTFGNIINANAPNCWIVAEMKCDRPSSECLGGRNMMTIQAASQLEVICSGSRMIVLTWKKLTRINGVLCISIVFSSVILIRHEHCEWARIGWKS